MNNKRELKRTNKRNGKVNFPIVGIGASAGGLEAFSSFLKSFPDSTKAAIIFIQHLTPDRQSGLTEILPRLTKIPVTEVKEGMKVEENHIYVMPPGVLMSLDGNILHLSNMKRPRGGLYHPIDHFFSSLAENKLERALGVVLSGTATDGTLGLKAIKGAGGITFAQDKTAKYDGMPQSAILADCVDSVLSPSKLAEEISRIIFHPFAAKKVTKYAVANIEKNLSDYQRILALLQKSKGIDFTNYKHPTINRRMNRRMLLVKLDSLKKYLDYINKNQSELEALYQDLLLDVTSFFRDPKEFNFLKGKIFPSILEKRTGKEPLRIWVVGCSTGEEVYSVAISYLEATAKKKKNISLQIFATDVNERVVNKARLGEYSKHIEEELSAERLERFFVKSSDGYRIKKEIREMCVFAKHDVTRDPPLSRMDLISCRNLLIYFNPVLQKKVLPILHYSLKPGGYLFLGHSEGVGVLPGLFLSAGKDHKIFVAKKTQTNGKLFGREEKRREEKRREEKRREEKRREPYFIYL